MTAKKNEKISHISRYGYVSVTSNINLKESNPYSVINPDLGVFWAPNQEAAHSEMLIAFDRPYMVNHVTIRWHNRPP